MKRLKYFVCVLLAFLVMTVSMASGMKVKASEVNNNGTNYNIELVVDASGSLVKADAEKNRFTAIDIFLQTLKEHGNNAGAVVFTEKIEVDTGLSAMESKAAKETLSNKIKSIEAWKGDTNIGLALDTAVKQLERIENDQESIILLLSDGNTDLGSEKKNEESLAIEDAAIQKCISSGIKVYGICLNHDDSADLGEFQNICSKTDGAFLEVKTSKNLTQALKDFYAQIFKTKYISDEKIIGDDGFVTKSIEVPAYGVEEINVTVDNASKISKITLTKPNEVDLSPNEFGGISSKIGEYYFIKITKPEAGTWKVTVQGEPNTKITFDYVFNTDDAVGIETVSGSNAFSVNEEIEIAAGFYENGSKLTGNQYYEGYKGTLVVNFAESDNENLQYYPMESDGENGYKYSLAYAEEGVYEVYAVLSCGEFESMSDSIVVSVGNNIPVFESDGEEFVTIKLKKLFGNSEKFDVSKYFSDKEAGALRYRLIASDYEQDEIALDGSEIELTNLVDGQFTVEAKDASGGTVTGVFKVEVQNLLILILAALAVIVLMIVVIIIMAGIKAKRRFFDGYLNVFSNSSVNDSNSVPQAAFRGKLSLAEFGLTNHQFDDSNMYFKVLKDSSVKGDASHRIQLVSAKKFYYQGPQGEEALNKLDMVLNMRYDIRSHSNQDFNAGDDSICISLDSI